MTKRAGPLPQNSSIGPRHIIPSTTSMLSKSLGAALLMTALLLTACAGTHHTANIEQDVAPVTAAREIQDDQLLDVAIKVFDPGTLPEDADERMGLSEEIRMAEAEYIPVHLKNTLQRSGFWGAVWVVPDDTTDADLMINGTIKWSDGEKLVVHIQAVDSRNVTWLDKTYSETCLPREHKDVEPGERDAFQDLYNAVSNDLAAFRNRLPPGEIARIRTMTALRYAASVSPEPFSCYISKDDRNEFTITRLPARDDPMMKRIRAIRARDQVLMDTLTGLYDNYYLQLWEPYQNWRKFRAEELMTMHQIEHDALTRQVLGFAAILGAIALGAISDQDVQRTIDPIRGIMAAGGTAAVYSGIQMRKETKMNKEVIEELGESFASESKPLVLEVNGETVRLTGTAKEQFARWQKMLRKIYQSETGLDQDLPVIIGVEETAQTTSTPDGPSRQEPSSSSQEEKTPGNE